ncbi:MAG: hypothetical protein QM763_00765 [Agriterribacter sp.]
MPNIRFPLKKPTSGHSNPYTIDFDFLPYPLVYPLTPDQGPFIYTTKIIINDQEFESSRIEHIFPNGKVYFIVDDSITNFNEIADKVVDGSFSGSIFGTWILLGTIKDIIAIKQSNLNTSFIPTAIIYNNIEVSDQIFVQIKQMLQEQYIVYSGSWDTPEEALRILELKQKIKEWLGGKIGLFINEYQIQSGNFLLPSVKQIDSQKILQIGALMMDGNGIEKKTMEKLIPLLRLNRSLNKLFDPSQSSENNDSPFNVGIIPIPLFNFLEYTVDQLMIDDHKTHPIKNSYPTDPRAWESCLFYINNSYRKSGIFSYLPYRKSFLEFEVEISSNRFPLHPSGLFFSRDLNGVSIKLVNKNSLSYKKLSLISKVEVPTGTDITLHIQHKIIDHYKIVVGEVSFDQIVDSGTYLNVSVNINNLQLFIDSLTSRLGTTLTEAEVFARALSFLSISLMKCFDRIPITFKMGNDNFKLIDPISLDYFISIAWKIFTDDSIRPEEVKGVF